MAAAAAAAAAPSHKPITFLLVSSPLITEILSSPGTAAGMLPEYDLLRLSAPAAATCRRLIEI